MLLAIVCAAFLAAKVSANGELVILQSPDSLVFKGHDHVKESIVKEIYSASLGFSTERYSNWNGLHIENPFDLPEAIVTVAVDGVSEIGITEGHHFPLRTDEDESGTYFALKRRIFERYPEGNSNLVRINLAEGVDQLSEYSIFKKENHKAKKPILHHLKLNVDEDKAFVNDITLLNTITNEVKNSVGPDHIPDVFWFKIDTLHALTDLYGENSTQVNEAKQLLIEAILHLNQVFTEIYEKEVLVSVISSDAIHTRKTRSILETEGETGPKINPAKYYSKDYPVIFNIILWFGVAMAFSVLAVCVAIASMDPGRDSIIYRMTSTRLKKDN